MGNKFSNQRIIHTSKPNITVIKPINHVSPVSPVNPAKSAKPINPVKPVNPVNHIRLVNPVKSVHSAKIHVKPVLQVLTINTATDHP